LNADAAEGALAAEDEALVVLGVDKARMGIETLQAAVDHVLDELTLRCRVERTDVLALDLFHDLDDKAYQGVVLILLVRRRAARHGIAKQKNTRNAQKPGKVPTWHEINSSGRTRKCRQKIIPVRRNRRETVWFPIALCPSQIALWLYKFSGSFAR